jgi:hypothetical protein
MPHESEVSLSPVLVTRLSPRSFAVGCRCAVCESRRTTRLAQALHNRYGRGLALMPGEINEP